MNTRTLTTTATESKLNKRCHVCVVHGLVGRLFVENTVKSECLVFEVVHVRVCMCACVRVGVGVRVCVVCVCVCVCV